jgi:hypothetical protein
VGSRRTDGRPPARGFDPPLLYLSLVGASVYPLLLPRVCELVTGEAPDTEEFAARYRAHLVALTELLGS